MRFIPLVLLTALTLSPTVNASEKVSKGDRVYGWVEKGVVIPADALVKIKLDSGALTSSMHAEDIDIYDRKNKKGDGVRFVLELEDRESGKVVEQKMDLDVERYLIVRGAGGEDRRPVVKLEICIGDRIFNEQFSLRDRGNMLYPVLLGRRTLSKLGLVDSGATFLTDPECKVALSRAEDDEDEDKS